MDFKKLFGYEGKNVVITGAASGMSYEATKLLISLGANVYAIDINATDLPVLKSLQADLSVKEEIDRVIDLLPDKIDALFLCHGIAHFKGLELQVQKVNFYGQKYMAEQLLDRMSVNSSITFISSVGGFGWQTVYKEAVELIDLATWDEAMKWYDRHPDLISNAYVFAKQCIEAYVTYKCMSKEYIEKKIRLNAINPGDTLTGLTSDFNKSTSPNGDEEEGEKIISDIFLKSWDGRVARPEEMGYPLVVIGSDICSYMSGQLIYIDYGLTSSWTNMSLLSDTKKTIEDISKDN